MSGAAGTAGRPARLFLRGALFLAAFVLALVLGGCGSASNSAPARSAPHGPRAELTIDYWPHGQGLDSMHVWKLTCPDGGGDHPAPRRSCAELAATPQPLAPPRGPCPMVIVRGAPVAEVRGTFEGMRVALLVRPTCGTAWRRLPVLLTGS